MEYYLIKCNVLIYANIYIYIYIIIEKKYYTYIIILNNNNNFHNWPAIYFTTAYLFIYVDIMMYIFMILYCWIQNLY